MKNINLCLTSILLVLPILNFRFLKFQPVQTERCNWANIDCNPHVKECTRAIAEEAWGQTGAVVYQVAAQWMRAKNGSSQYLDETQKLYLRPYFGDLVDRVMVIYDAKLMDDWLYAGFKVDIGQEHSIAQTYCKRIYVDDPYKPGDFGQITLLAHELIHSRQCEQFSGAAKFGYYYFREFKRADQNYENNKLEREAEDFQRQFAGWLSNQLANNQAASEDV
jgi:hypothetical protein